MKGELGKKFRQDVRWVAVEGTIAAGKSTLLKKMRAELEQEFGQGSVLFIQEPVKLWLASGHLQKAGDEPYVAQTFFFHTRIEAFLMPLEELSEEEARKVRFIVTERSIFSDYHVFWYLSCQNGLPTALAQDTYPPVWATWKRLLPFEKPDLFLYLTVDVDTAQERMVKRERECEQGTVSWEYQRQLIERHDSLFTEGSTFEGAPCTELSTLRPYHEDEEAKKEVAAHLIKVLHSLPQEREPTTREPLQITPKRPKDWTE